MTCSRYARGSYDRPPDRVPSVEDLWSSVMIRGKVVGSSLTSADVATLHTRASRDD